VPMMAEGGDMGELSDAAKRGLQRAGVHLVKAALEVVAGLSAFLEEVNATRSDADRAEDDGPERIDLD
jgi:hypothetical protein